MCIHLKMYRKIPAYEGKGKGDKKNTYDKLKIFSKKMSRKKDQMSIFLVQAGSQVIVCCAQGISNVL